MRANKVEHRVKAGALLGAALLLAGCVSGPAAEPRGRPDATGTSSAQPSERLAQPFGLKWNGYGYPARYGQVIAGYRNGATFHDITWCAVERDRGDLRWTTEDRVIDDALRHGLEVLIRIHVGTCWVNGRPADSRPRASASLPPSDLTAYQTFVRTLVDHYAARGVRAYALENEIDAENYWAADPAAYPPVARAGAAAVRSADSRARVVDPGLSSSSYGIAVARSLGDTAEAVQFYKAFYARRGTSRLPRVSDTAGLRQAAATSAGRRIMSAHAAVRELHRSGLFDVYQLHYYDPWLQLPRVLGYLRGLARAPIEAWEAGSYWPDTGYDPERHAAETAQLATTLLTGGVRKVIYLPLFHTAGRIAPQERWRGLFERDGSPRPAAAMLERLRDSTGSGIWHAVDRPGLRGALVVRNHSTTLVLWTPDGRTRPVRTPDGVERDVTATPTVISTTASAEAAQRWLETA